MESTISSLLTLSLLSLQSMHDPCHFPAIFNFGDSNSDTGGLSASFGQASPPNGASFFGSPAGRYCDGRLVIDFIAESLGLPYLSAFLDSVGSNFSHGANFATMGSPIRAINASYHRSGYSPFSLDVQFVQFSDFLNRSQTIATVDIPEIISQFKNAVMNIYKKGGRYFWIHNTGPIGCLAYVLENRPIKASDFDSYGCASPLNNLAQQFNHALEQAVIELRTFLSEAAITYVDVYSAKYELFVNAQGHGFNQSLVSCCGHGGKYNFNKHIGCGKKVIVEGKEIYIGKPCDEPDKAVVWDGYHFTQAANKVIFDKIVTGLSMACQRKAE